MLLSTAAVAVCCSMILPDRVISMQYAVLQPFSTDDEDPSTGGRLPEDATRSGWDDEKVHGRRQQEVPWMNPFAPVTRRGQPPPLLRASPSLPRDLGPARGLEDPSRRDVGTAGAGFGAACGPRERCSSSLGLACLKTEHEDSRCGCAMETPVFINEGGVKKCVRAKAMYESCVSHLECSYRHPNLQCVDFLCYCPLPYVLTEAHRCLAPSAPHNNMAVVIASTAVLAAVLVLIGGALSYKKLVGSGHWSLASGLFTVRSAAKRHKDSMRRASSAIRLEHKAGARRPRHSLAEHRAVQRDSGVPRRPPQFIRPREESVQKSFLQGVRASTIKEETTLSSESPGFTSNPVLPRCAAKAASKAVNVQCILPLHEEVSVHIIHKRQTSDKASQELSTEVPRKRQSLRAADRRESPTRLLRRMLDEAEVKVNVEGNGSSDYQDAQRLQLPKLIRDHSTSQPSRPSICKLLEPGTGESATEDSFMRELRYQVKASSPKPSVQDRAVSTDIAFTKDTAVQLDRCGRDKVDKSQQMSDVPSLGVDDRAIAPVRQLVQIIERRTAVPVEKLVQEIEPNQAAVKITKLPVEKKVEEGIAKSELISTKDMKTRKQEKCDASSVQEKQEPPSITGGKSLKFLRRILSDSLKRRSDQHVARDLLTPDGKATKGDSRNLLKSDFKRVTSDNFKGVEKVNDCGMTTTMPTSPKLSQTGTSDLSTTRCPAFKDILQELIQKQTQNNASVTPPKASPRKKIPEKAPQQHSGHSSTTLERATCTSLARTNSSPKGSVRESPFLLKPPEVIWNLSPPLPGRFYTTIVQESDMLCPSVQGTAEGAVNGTSSNERRSDEGKLHHEMKDSAPPGSLNVSTTAVQEFEPRQVRSFLHPYSSRDDGKSDDKRVVPAQHVRNGGSSDDLIMNIEKKPYKVYAGGDSFSGSGETPSDGSKLECHDSLNSPGNGGPGLAILMGQELEAARTGAGVAMEQTFIFPKIENNWSMTSPEAILGSIDLQSSDTSLGSVRAAFRQSVDMTSRMQEHREETAVMADALKVKNKRSEPRKRVNFREKPFADVLAEIEDNSGPDWSEPAEGGRKEPANDKRLVETTVRSSKNYSEENADSTFIESRGDADNYNEADKTGNRDAEDAEEGMLEEKAKCLVAAALERGVRQASCKIMEQVTAQGQHAGAARSLVECGGLKELAVHNRELHHAPSRSMCSKDDFSIHPFCPSEEGSLLPSASTTLTFLSSDSNVSVVHRATDLTSLQALAHTALPFQETGDGKLGTRTANLPDSAQPLSHALQKLDQGQREPLPPRQLQEGEQQWKGIPMLSSPRPPSAEDRSTRSSRRLRVLEQAKPDESRQDRKSSRPPKRPNTGERQRVSRFAAKERRWGDDIIRVILMGNKHYLHERSTTSPRPLSASTAPVPALDETQYIAQQIEQAHATDKDVVHTCPSPELCLAAGVVRTVAVPEETAITPAQPRILSACDGMQAPACASDTGLDQQVPSSPSGRVSQRPSPGACSGSYLAPTPPYPLAATHQSTCGPCGEQPILETIAKVVCEIELHNPQAVSEAMGRKTSELGPVYVLSGDTIELVKSPVQTAVIEDLTNHFVPSLISELGAAGQLTFHQCDARERDLTASVKHLSAALATPESFSKTVGLPSPDDLLLSDTDGVASSSIVCSVDLEPNASALSHARTVSPISVRGRCHSPKIDEVPCFESIYNSILQPRSSPGPALGISMLGERDFSGNNEVPERSSASTSKCSAIPCLIKDCRGGGALPVAATTSKITSLAPGLTAPKPSAGGSQVLMPHETYAAAAYREGREKPVKLPPSLSAEASPIKDSGCSCIHPPTTAVVLHSQAAVSNMLDDAGSQVEECSSFFSFEESASETSLLPDAGALGRRASSAALRSRVDLG